jgi:hypothetical protein
VGGFNDEGEGKLRRFPGCHISASKNCNATRQDLLYGLREMAWSPSGHPLSPNPFIHHENRLKIPTGFARLSPAERLSPGSTPGK